MKKKPFALIMIMSNGSRIIKTSNNVRVLIFLPKFFFQYTTRLTVVFSEKATKFGYIGELVSNCRISLVLPVKVYLLIAGMFINKLN